jgi:site-specific DNA-methyltransferase (adenine-specific)
MLEINKIHHWDCLELMKQMPDKSIDMILCDLPYGTTACKWDTIIPFEPLWEQYKRIIKDNGAIVLTASQPFTSALVMSNPKMFKYEWIWEKHKATNFYMANKQPFKIHENILVFYNKQSTYNPQKIEGKDYKQRGGHNISIEGVTHGHQIWYSKDHQTDKRLPISIQKFQNHNQKENRYHPTQKPVPLFEYLIKTYTNEGDLVLDNCAGSWTTWVACMNTKRNYIMIEQLQEYVDIANKRLSEIVEKK